MPCKMVSSLERQIFVEWMRTIMSSRFKSARDSYLPHYLFPFRLCRRGASSLWQPAVLISAPFPFSFFLLSFHSSSLSFLFIFLIPQFLSHFLIFLVAPFHLSPIYLSFSFILLIHFFSLLLPSLSFSLASSKPSSSFSFSLSIFPFYLLMFLSPFFLISHFFSAVFTDPGHSLSFSLPFFLPLSLSRPLTKDEAQKRKTDRKSPLTNCQTYLPDRLACYCCNFCVTTKAGCRSGYRETFGVADSIVGSQLSVSRLPCHSPSPDQTQTEKFTLFWRNRKGCGVKDIEMERYPIRVPMSNHRACCAEFETNTVFDRFGLTILLFPWVPDVLAFCYSVLSQKLL